MKANAVIRQIIDFLRDIGWGVTIGSVVLLVGGFIVYRDDTKKKKAERSAHADTRS
jgi:hypothetical protein